MSALSGFMHASVYKFKRVDLSEKRDRGMPIHDHFNNIEKGAFTVFE